jgi:DNA-binding MarR family transcriptional regulator
MSNDASSLPLEVLSLFRIIIKSTSKHFEKIEKKVGISGAQLWALSEVVNESGITVTNLAHAMSLHQTTTSNLINTMESRNLVTRERSEHDRRLVKIHPTEQGLAILKKAPGPFKGILPDALMRLNDTDLLMLKDKLQLLASLLEHKAEKAAREPLGTPIRSK